MHHSPYPLTRLILDLASADRQRLAKADPVKIAEHYGLPEDWAREYLNRARGLR
jgi:hypothetical protein